MKIFHPPGIYFSYKSIMEYSLSFNIISLNGFLKTFHNGILKLTIVS